MRDGLKPCPFCGGEAHTTETARYGKRYGVACFCGASVRFFDTEAKAIAAWNARYRCGLTDEDYNILLDELGVSERTCHMEESFIEPSRLDFMQEYLCSECGEYSYMQIACEGDGLSYCPNCGARVVDAWDERRENG